MGRDVAQYLEREVMEAIAREHRRRLIKRFVDGGLAAAQIVIVHARQIVVDHRVDVDRLDRRAGADRALLVHPEQARGGDGQQRPEPLAAANPGMAHRREQAVAAIARVSQQ